VFREVNELMLLLSLLLHLCCCATPQMAAIIRRIRTHLVRLEHESCHDPLLLLSTHELADVLQVDKVDKRRLFVGIGPQTGNGHDFVRGVNGELVLEGGAARAVEYLTKLPVDALVLRWANLQYREGHRHTRKRGSFMDDLLRAKQVFNFSGDWRVGAVAWCGPPCGVVCFGVHPGLHPDSCTFGVPFAPLSFLVSLFLPFWQDCSAFALLTHFLAASEKRMTEELRVTESIRLKQVHQVANTLFQHPSSPQAPSSSQRQIKVSKHRNRRRRKTPGSMSAELPTTDLDEAASLILKRLKKLGCPRMLTREAITQASRVRGCRLCCFKTSSSCGAWSVV